MRLTDKAVCTRDMPQEAFKGIKRFDTLEFVKSIKVKAATGLLILKTALWVHIDCSQRAALTWNL